jgi:hypothetical protein
MLSKLLVLPILVFICILFLANFYVVAQSEQGEFALQVSPSPIIDTLQPGTTKTIELKIRNNGTKTEDLKIEPRGFNFNDQSSEVKLNDNVPADIANWITFGSPTFKIAPGEWFTQRIYIKVPKNAGFSYSFALLINRQKDIEPVGGKPALRGSVAVFTLLNVDRPDAKKELSIANFSTPHRMYEYLPVEFNVTLKNNGNTIIQPYGNIFIQRDTKSANPISTLPVNETKGYILPGTTRNLKSSWGDGFPQYVTAKKADNAQPKQDLKWDWSNLKNLRIGRYSAKLVGVYNDGSRDIPLEAQIYFWVIPWKIILGFIIVLVVLVIGIWTIIKKSLSIIKKPKKSQKSDEITK